MSGPPSLAAHARRPERLFLGAPEARHGPPVVTLERLEPSEPLLTAEQRLSARETAPAATPSRAPRPSPASVIHLPGVRHPLRGADSNRALPTWISTHRWLRRRETSRSITLAQMRAHVPDLDRPSKIGYFALRESGRLEPSSAEKHVRH